MRNLGRFFGHLGRAIKTDPAATGTEQQAAREVRREVEHEETTGPGGERVTLRRTTIEEIEVRPGTPDEEGR